VGSRTLKVSWKAELKLRAADSSDVEVIASAIQDSIFQIGQARFEKTGRSFTLRLSRYMHELGNAHRIESGLRFDGVLSVSSQGRFCCYPMLRITVECIDVTLADRGDPRPTKRIPKHDG